MYSEANRRETFTSWPHVGYRWAQPDPMAQAGFYHQVKNFIKKLSFFVKKHFQNPTFLLCVPCVLMYMTLCEFFSSYTFDHNIDWLLYHVLCTKRKKMC